MPANKQKNLILSAVSVATGFADKETVQRLKHREPTGFVSLRSVLVEAGVTPDEKMLASVAEFYSKFRELDDVEFKEKYPDLEELWDEGEAKPVYTGAARGRSSLPKKEVKEATVAELLAKLNVLRKRASMFTFKTWKKSRKELEAEIKKLEGKKPKKTKCPPAIAEGAYENSRLAPKLTDGKRRQASAKGGAAASKARHERPEGMIHLSDIAAELKMSPKKARIRARKLGSKLSKLETGKYLYSPEKKADVLKLMGGK